LVCDIYRERDRESWLTVSGVNGSGRVILFYYIFDTV
jgi:hypothetical protein